MRAHTTRQATTWLIAATTAMLTTACGSLFPSAQMSSDAAPVKSQIAADAVVFATMRNTRTEQGGSLESYVYAEKPGDATLGKLSVTGGVASVVGTLSGQRGSTWGGVALNVNAGPGNKTVNMSAHKALTLQLAGTGPALRVRLMGNDRATRDNGCYPIAVVPVTPELREYRVELTSFAAESFCGTRAAGVAATSSALAAVEVADATVTVGKRDVDIRVGRIAFVR